MCVCMRACVCHGYSRLKVLAQIQDGLVNNRVGPVVPQIIQVTVKINQVLIGTTHQQGRCDFLCFAPVLKGVTGKQFFEKLHIQAINSENTG